MNAAHSKLDQSLTHSENYLLRLYVAGNGRRSINAISNIKNICERYLKGGYQLEVIDLYQQPERAKIDQIVAIPTLVKEFPLPARRIIGSLSNAAQVCAVLEIETRPHVGWNR
jgi:circadian clock protein KaiB